MSKKLFLALGGNALGDDPAGQMKAVKNRAGHLRQLTL